jgi:hypothetical protein
VIDLLLSDVVLHILLCNIDIWLSKLVFLILLHLQLLHSLKLIELEFTANWLRRVPVSSSLVPRVAPPVVHVVPSQITCIVFLHLEGPVLHDIVFSLQEFIPQILDDRFSTFIDDGSSDSLQGIAINLDSFDCFVYTQQVRDAL